MKKYNENYEEPNFEDVIEKTDVDEFEIGQGYDAVPDKKIRCKKCGSTEFIVGVGDYHTAIKCPKCKWELCIHEG
jgi:DNA-directed RNA polymerase subunit RPC12/RpoP